MADTWDSLLEEGEEILWTGRPETGPHLRQMLGPLISVGVLALVATVFFDLRPGDVVAYARGMLSDVASSNDWIVFFLIGGFIAVIGVFATFASIWERRRVWYTLTNRRALIARTRLLRGRQLLQFRLHPTQPIFLDKTDDPPSVVLATESFRASATGDPAALPDASAWGSSGSPMPRRSSR